MQLARYSPTSTKVREQTRRLVISSQVHVQVIFVHSFAFIMTSTSVCDLFLLCLHSQYEEGIAPSFVYRNYTCIMISYIFHFITVCMDLITTN